MNASTLRVTLAELVAVRQPHLVALILSTLKVAA